MSSWGCWVFAFAVISTSSVEVTAPPTKVREQLGLAKYYEKYLAVHGLAVVSSGRVSDAALREAAYLINQMIGHRPDILAAMCANKTRFAIMSPDELTTQIPEHSDLRPRKYWDRRARGLGATAARPAVSCGEENLLELPGDPYSSENILIHEFAHAIHEMGLVDVDVTFDARLSDAYQIAMKGGLWKSKYAATNHHEYWAEGVQSWFDTNRENDHDHNHVNTRSELREYDPTLASLVEEVFGDRDWKYVKPSRRKDKQHLADYDPTNAPTFSWPERLTQWYREYEKTRERRKRKSGESDLDWLQRIAADGDHDAQIDLGVRYRDGVGLKQNDALAVQWYRRASDGGHLGGHDSLGWMYKMGRGVARDDTAALTLFRRSADGGHNQGMFNLGVMLKDGRGAKVDRVAAYRWLHIAATRGHRWAGAARDDLRTELTARQIEAAEQAARAWRPTPDGS